MSGEYDLYGGRPPHVARDTSAAAADAIQSRARQLREQVRAEVARSGKHGMTCDEVEALLEMRHQTASARIRELVLTGRLHDSRKRRATRSGRQAIIWVAEVECKTYRFDRERRCWVEVP